MVDNQEKLSIYSFSGTHLVIMNSGFDNESTTKVNNNNTQQESTEQTVADKAVEQQAVAE